MLNEKGKINNDREDIKLVFLPPKKLGDVFIKELKIHKSFLSSFNATRNEKLIVPFINSGECLALAYSGFKCEKCFTEDNLQLHHLIQRKTKSFTDAGKYVTQRYYWSNIIVLCNSCHAEYHHFDKPRFILESLCITKQKINKLKELYKINNMELNKELEELDN